MFDTLHPDKELNKIAVSNATLQAILDVNTGEFFEISVMTLIHLGAKNIRLYPGDLETTEL